MKILQHYQTPGAFHDLLEKQVVHYGFKFWNLQGLWKSKIVGWVIEPGPDPVVMKEFPMISKQLWAGVLKQTNKQKTNQQKRERLKKKIDLTQAMKNSCDISPSTNCRGGIEREKEQVLFFQCSQ